MAARCNTCNKTSTENGGSLKRCSKCMITIYCSRECQAADWKLHKKSCSAQYTAHSNGAGPQANAKEAPRLQKTHCSPKNGFENPITESFIRLENGQWLHDRPETDVYRLLIDAYRMRVEDDYTFKGDAPLGSIYSGRFDSLPDFRRFLKRVESTNNGSLLPPWWSCEKKKACIKLAMDRNEWQSLYTQVEKSDIIEHYGNPLLPMQLRAFAETVLDRGP